MMKLMFFKKIINRKKDPTEEMVKRNYTTIQYVKNPSEKLISIALKQNGHAIQYIDNDNITEKIQIKFLKKEGKYWFQYIKNPTEKAKLYAIKKCAVNIQFIENPTEEMKLLALKKNGLTL